MSNTRKLEEKVKLRSKCVMLVIISSMLTGCASTTGIDPSLLNKSTSKSYVEIEKPFRWSERFNIEELTQNLTIAAGIYKAKYDDGTTGTYFEGKGKCLTIKVNYDDKDKKETSNAMRCGIFVPNSSDNRVIVYYYIDPVANRKTLSDNNAGLLIQALGEAEEDNLKHLMYQPEEAALKAAIKVVN